MDRARWLVKALYEASDKVYEALLAADEATDDPATPGPRDQVLQAAWDLEVHERSTGWHLEQILLGGRDRLKLHAAEWLLPHPDQESPEETRADGAVSGATRDDIAALARTYAMARRATCGLLAGLPARYWRWSAEHPFRGLVTVEDLAAALHERAIETSLLLTRTRQRPPIPTR